MKQVKHWQDPVNAALGAWLMVSPWVLGFQDVVIAVLSMLAIGALLVVCNLGAISVPQAWEEWLDASLGGALMLAPTLLGFDAVDRALMNALLTGGIVTLLALWVLVTDNDFAGTWERLVG
jgi:hypothetical protein